MHARSLPVTSYLQPVFPCFAVPLVNADTYSAESHEGLHRTRAWNSCTQQSWRLPWHRTLSQSCVDDSREFRHWSVCFRKPVLPNMRQRGSKAPGIGRCRTVQSCTKFCCCEKSDSSEHDRQEMEALDDNTRLERAHDNIRTNCIAPPREAEPPDNQKNFSTARTTHVLMLAQKLQALAVSSLP